MSNTIDNRVVSMEFDNARFQRNIEESVQSLHNLDKTLYGMKDSVASVGKVNDALQNIRFADVQAALDQTAKGFTNLEYFAAGAMYRIGEQAVNLGERLIKNLAIDQIAAGWEKYGEKTTAVQTIMSATGASIEYVSEQLDRLNWFTDETSYSFTDMTGNIAKFTAQQIPLEEAVTAMEGIATWAAKSGQNAQTASRAMYNFSQALGVGFMSVADWKSIELANMATTEFKQLVIDTAVELGKLQKVGDQIFSIDPQTAKLTEVTLENFRTTLQDRWFDTEVINASLNKYGAFADALSKVVQEYEDYGLTATRALYYTNQMALGMDVSREMAEEYGDAWSKIAGELEDLSDEEYRFGREAFQAAQEAKTLQEAIDATKDAASTVWMNLFENLIGGYDKAKKFFTEVANELYDIFVEPVNEINSIIIDAFGSNWDKISKAVTNAGGSIEDFKKIVIEVGSVTNSNFANEIEAAGGFDDAIQKGVISMEQLRTSIRKMRDGDYLKEVGDGARKAVSSINELEEVVKGVLVGDYGNGMGANGNRRNRLLEAGYDPDLIQKYAEKIHAGQKLTEEDLKEYQDAIKDYLHEDGEALGDLNDILAETYGMENAAISNGQKLRDSITGILNIVGTIFTQIREGFAEAFGNDTVTGLQNVVSSIYDFVQRAKEAVAESTFIHDVAFSIGKVIKTIITLLGSLFKIGKLLFDTVVGPGLSFAMKIVARVASMISDLAEVIAPVVEWITDKISVLFYGIRKGITTVSSFFDTIKLIFTRLKDHSGFLGYEIQTFLEKHAPKLLDFLQRVGFFFENFSYSVKKLFGDKVAKIVDYLINLKTALGIQDFQYYVNRLIELTKSLYNSIKSITQEVIAFFQSDEFKNSKIGKLIANITDKVNKLWSAIKSFDLKAYMEDLKNRVSAFWESLNGMSIVEKIQAIIRKVKEKVTETWDYIAGALGVQNWDKMFADILSKIGLFFSNVWSKITKFFKDLKTKISEVVNDIPGTYQKIKKSLSAFKDQIKEKFPLTFDIVVGALSGLWDSIKTMVVNLKNKIVGFFKGDQSMLVAGKEFFSNFFEGIKASFPKITEAISKIKEFFTTLISSFDTQVDWNNVLTNVGSLGEFIGKLSGAIKNIGVGIGAALGGAGLASLLGTTKSIRSAVSSVVTNFAGIEKSISKFFDAWRAKKVAESFVEIGKALILIAGTILILIGGLYALSKIPKDDIVSGMAIISILLFELGIVMGAMFGMLALAKNNGGAISVAGAFLGVVALIASLLILAKGIQKFYDIPKDVWTVGGLRIIEALLAVSAIIAALILLSKGGVNGGVIVTQSDVKGIGIAFVGLVVALDLLVKVLKKVYDLVAVSDEKTLRTATGIIDELMIFLGLMTLLAGKSNATLSNSLAAIAIVGSVALLIECLKSIQQLCDTYEESKSLKQAVGTLALIGVIIGALVYLVGNNMPTDLKSAASTVISLIAIAALILTLAYSMKLIAETLPYFENISTEGFVKFAAVLAAVIFTLSKVLPFIQPISLAMTGFAIFLGAIAVDILAAAAAFLMVSKSLDDFVTGIERLTKIKFNKDSMENLKEFFISFGEAFKALGNNGLDRLIGSWAFQNLTEFMKPLVDTLVRFASNWSRISAAFGDDLMMDKVVKNIGKLYSVVRSKGDWVYDSYNFDAIGAYISKIGEMVTALSAFSNAYEKGDLSFFMNSGRDTSRIFTNIGKLFEVFSNYSSLATLAVSSGDLTVIRALFDVIKEFSDNKKVLDTFAGEDVGKISGNLAEFYSSISQGMRSMLTDVSTMEMQNSANAMSSLIDTAEQFADFWRSDGLYFRTLNFDNIKDQFTGMTSSLSSGFENLNDSQHTFYAVTDAGHALTEFSNGITDYVAAVQKNAYFLEHFDLSNFTTNLANMLSALDKSSTLITLFEDLGINANSVNVITYLSDGIQKMGETFGGKNIGYLTDSEKITKVANNLVSFFGIIGKLNISDNAKALGLISVDQNAIVMFANGLTAIGDSITATKDVFAKEDDVNKFKQLAQDFLGILTENQDIFYGATHYDDGVKMISYVDALDQFIDVLERFASAAASNTLTGHDVTKLQQFTTNVKELLSTIGGNANANVFDGLALNAVGEGLLRIFDFVEEYSGLSSGLDWSSITAGLAGIMAVFSGRNAKESIENLIKFTGSGSSWMNVGSGFSALLESMGKFAAFGSGENVGLTNFTQLVEGLKSLIDISKNLTGVGEAIKTEMNSLTSALNPDSIQDVINYMVQIGKILYEAVVGGFDQAINGISESPANRPFSERLASMLNSQAFKLLSNEALSIAFAKVGQYAMDGLITGINSKGSSVNSAVMSICQDLIRTAEKTLNEHSPSKVFEKIGEYVSEGLAIGVRNKADTATSAVKDMSENTIDTMQYAMNSISAVLNSDSSLTIRPVLDMSDIESGASYISSILGDKQIALAGKIGSINAQIQNGRLNGPAASLVSLDEASLSRLAVPVGQDMKPIDVNVTYGGSLAYLAQILQPAIESESIRVGSKMVK